MIQFDGSHIFQRGWFNHQLVMCCQQGRLYGKERETELQRPQRVRFLHEPGSKLLVLGMVIQPLIGNPYNIYNGYINPYGLGLMSLSPIIWKCHGSLDPIAHMTITNPVIQDWATWVHCWICGFLPSDTHL